MIDFYLAQIVYDVRVNMYEYFCCSREYDAIVITRATAKS